MFQLTINHLPCTLAKGTSFKLTLENPAFSSSYDRTLEVTLPLKGCHTNQHIFGAMHHTATQLTPLLSRTYPFTLLADGLAMQGTAVVLSATEESVKVQLRSGRGGLTPEALDAEGNERYIDELPLGRAYDTYLRHRGKDPESITALELLTLMSEAPEQEEQFLRTGLPSGIFHRNTTPTGDAECVCFPIYSVAESAVSNAKTIQGFHKDGKFVLIKEGWPLARNSYGTGSATPNGKQIEGMDTTGVEVDPKTIFAPQIYLCVLLERILKVAYGTTLRKEDNALRWDYRLARLFVANARGVMDYNKTLPHWTVTEFIREVENFCGVVVLVGTNGARVVNRSEFYASEVQYLQHVVHEHTAELSPDDNGADPTASNIAYQWNGIENVFNLEDDIWHSAKVIEQGGILEIEDNTPETMTPEARRTIIINRQNGNRYIYIENEDGTVRPLEVDQGGALIRRESRDIDITLRIVPALMTKEKVNQQILRPGFPRKWHPDPQAPAIDAPMLMTADTNRGIDNGTFDIWNTLTTGGKDQTNTKDTLEVALNMGTQYSLFTYQWQGATIIPPAALGFTFHRNTQNHIGDYADGKEETINGVHYDYSHLFSLNSPTNIVRGLNTLTGRIDTRVEYLFTFTDPVPLDTSKTYQIGTRHFLPARFEITITPQGIAPLKTGYFYELAP